MPQRSQRSGESRLLGVLRGQVDGTIEQLRIAQARGLDDEMIDVLLETLSEALERLEAAKLDDAQERQAEQLAAEHPPAPEPRAVTGPRLAETRRERRRRQAALRKDPSPHNRMALGYAANDLHRAAAAHRAALLLSGQRTGSTTRRRVPPSRRSAQRPRSRSRRTASASRAGPDDGPGEAEPGEPPAGRPTDAEARP